MGRSRGGFTLLELIIVIALIAIVAALAIPNIIAARKHANEGAAIGNLKTVVSAQTLFKEQDKENDTNFDYGTLVELSTEGVVDVVIGTGTRQGYLFRVEYSATTSDFLWYGTCNPALPRSSGDLYFCVNQRGVIFYTFENSLAMNNTDCIQPPNVIPVFTR